MYGVVWSNENEKAKKKNAGKGNKKQIFLGYELDAIVCLFFFSLFSR